jgi:hypothetical protein
MNKDLVWKETAVIYFKISQNLPVGTEEKQENPQSGKK